MARRTRKEAKKSVRVGFKLVYQSGILLLFTGSSRPSLGSRRKDGIYLNFVCADVGSISSTSRDDGAEKSQKGRTKEMNRTPIYRLT